MLNNEYLVTCHELSKSLSHLKKFFDSLHEQLVDKTFTPVEGSEISLEVAQALSAEYKRIIKKVKDGNEAYLKKVKEKS